MGRKKFDIDQLTREQVGILSVQLGEKVRDIFDKATNRANKILKKYNMECRIVFKIQELGTFPDKKSSEEQPNLINE